MRIYIYTICFLSLMMMACSSEDIIEEDRTDSENVELSFQVSGFIKGTKASTNENFIDEEIIENLYVFLFPTTSLQPLRTYNISTSTFDGGIWDSVNNKISLNLTQAEAGKRDVYVVANYSSELKTVLDKVKVIKELQSILQSSDTPWFSMLNTPVLMSGNTTHNFNSNYQLNCITLIRALSKVQLNIKLSNPYQGLPVSTEGIAQYKYKLINFEKNTYILKPTSKNSELISLSSWTNWNDQITSYTLDDRGKVISLTMTTYMNESDNTETAIKLSLPYVDGGFLPPPEFGDEVYTLQMPIKIERNYWYVYDIEI